METKVDFLFSFFPNKPFFFVFFNSKLNVSVFYFQIDSDFSWANAGAMVFKPPVSCEPKPKTDDGSDEEEAPTNVDIHFEPIVSLPEVKCTNTHRLTHVPMKNWRKK